MSDQLFGDSFFLLEKSLDLRMARQGLLASNIANAETPGYRALDIDFEKALSEIVERQKGTGADPSKAEEPLHVPLVAADSPSPGSENNTVQFESEMSKASRNMLMFNLQAQILGMKLRQMGEAIQTP